MYNLVSNQVGGPEALNEGEVPQGVALKKGGTQDIGLSALHTHTHSRSVGRQIFSRENRC